MADSTTEEDKSNLMREAKTMSLWIGYCISGGTVNVGCSWIAMCTIAAAKKSTVLQLVILLDEVQAHCTPTEKLVDSLEGPELKSQFNLYFRSVFILLGWWCLSQSMAGCITRTSLKEKVDNKFCIWSTMILCIMGFLIKVHWVNMLLW